MYIFKNNGWIIFKINNIWINLYSFLILNI